MEPIVCMMGTICPGFTGRTGLTGLAASSATFALPEAQQEQVTAARSTDKTVTLDVDWLIRGALGGG